MPELFVVYELRPRGRCYIRDCLDGYPIWNDNKATALSMEKAIAGLWVQVLNTQEPLSTFGMEPA